MFILLLSCEKPLHDISFEKFIIGTWVAQENNIATELIIFENGTYVLKKKYDTVTVIYTIEYPENTYTTEKIGEFYYITFTEFDGSFNETKMKILWNTKEDSNTMVWDREDLLPLFFYRTIE